MTNSEHTPRKRSLYQNWVSQLGMLVALGSSVIIALLILTQQVDPTASPYIGMFTYMLLPGVILSGFVLILGGMRWEAGRRKRSAALAKLPYPRLDLNDPRQRSLFGVFVVITATIGTIMAWAGYEGYIYTESVSFCGRTCHTPMTPEYTAYLDSSHARVRCVECHVGDGAGWYFRSKLQGAPPIVGRHHEQIRATDSNTHQKPAACARNL